jgi:hypothetical protein
MGSRHSINVGWLIKTVIEAGATIRVLDRSYVDLKTPIGRGFMAMFSALPKMSTTTSTNVPMRAEESLKRVA